MHIGVGRGAVAVHTIDSAITEEEDVVRRLCDANVPKADGSRSVVRKPWWRCLGNAAAAAAAGR